MTDSKKLLLEILEITNFEGETEAFAEMFMDLIFEETVYSLMKSLPEKRREKAATKWDNNTENQAALNSILEHYFTKVQIADASEKTASKAINDYLHSIEKTLDDGQKAKLRELPKVFNLNI